MSGLLAFPSLPVLISVLLAILTWKHTPKKAHTFNCDQETVTYTSLRLLCSRQRNESSGISLKKVPLLFTVYPLQPSLLPFSSFVPLIGSYVFLLLNCTHPLHITVAYCAKVLSAPLPTNISRSQNFLLFFKVVWSNISPDFVEGFQSLFGWGFFFRACHSF